MISHNKAKLSTGMSVIITKVNETKESVVILRSVTALTEASRITSLTANREQQMKLTSEFKGS